VAKVLPDAAASESCQAGPDQGPNGRACEIFSCKNPIDLGIRVLKIEGISLRVTEEMTMKASTILTFVANALYLTADMSDARKQLVTRALMEVMPRNARVELAVDLVNFIDMISVVQIKLTAQFVLHLASTAEMIENPISYWKRLFASFSMLIENATVPTDEHFAIAELLTKEMEKLMGEEAPTVH